MHNEQYLRGGRLLHINLVGLPCRHAFRVFDLNSFYMVASKKAIGYNKVEGKILTYGDSDFMVEEGSDEEDMGYGFFGEP